LQRQHPPGTPIRAILIDNTETDEPLQPPGGHPDARNLFSDNGGQDIGKGITAPSATIFAARWDDLGGSTHLGSTRFVNYLQVSTTTVANEAYEVAAGSPVDVLVLSLDGPISSVIGVTTNPANYAAIGEFAEDATSQEVVSFVREWFERTATSG